MDSLCSRRKFLEFMGLSGISVAAQPLEAARSKSSDKPIIPSGPERRDQLVLAPGVQSYLVLTSRQRINPTGDLFGVNNDYLGFIPDTDSHVRGRLLVNHEFPDPLATSDGRDPTVKSKADFDAERSSVGCSVLTLAFEKKMKRWALSPSDPRNLRLDASTAIPFADGASIKGSSTAIGTFANCSGGVTPWRTFLTCEENFHDYYGASTEEQKAAKTKDRYGWLRFFQPPPEHYGWVVEINPETGSAKKLTGLGRFAHEGALVVPTPSGRCVVYMGDDAEGECLYKFIATAPGSLEKGTLYVADLKQGRWMPLSIESASPALKSKYKSDLELLIDTRSAAKLAGGTALDRPEGIARNPITGQIVVSLTNNVTATPPNYYGSLLGISEDGSDPLALSFKHSTFAVGGVASGFACPDNLAFDQHGGLWVATDISGKYMNQGPYEALGNNGLFYIATSGPQAGVAQKIASAPTDAEFTGPCIMPDGETILVSVQHPGEMSESKQKFTSHWPDPAASPKSAVVALTGKKIASLLRGENHSTF